MNDEERRTPGDLLAATLLGHADPEAGDDDEQDVAHIVPQEISAPAELPLAASDGGVSVIGGFPPAPPVPGEFRLVLNVLAIGKHAIRSDFDFDTGPGKALLHAVVDIDSIAPITVMESDGGWHVVDGWLRVLAMRTQYGDTANVMVRVVKWEGSAEHAVYDRFQHEFLGLASRKVEKARLLLQVHRIWQVPQIVLAARIGWTQSKVSKHLDAAVADEEAPDFARLLLKPLDPPIDYLYKVQRARDLALEDDKDHPKRAPENGAVARLIGKLDQLLAKPDRFSPAEALEKLGIEKKVPGKSATGQPDATLLVEAPELIDHVMGHDDQPIAAFEMTSDNFVNIRFLIDPAQMSAPEKEEARARLRDAIDRFIG